VLSTVTKILGNVFAGNVRAVYVRGTWVRIGGAAHRRKASSLHDAWKSIGPSKTHRQVRKIAVIPMILPTSRSDGFVRSIT
jgi:hypothetical protein